MKPAWLTLVDAGNGTATLSGTPANADVGPHAVTLAVSDGTVTVEQSFTVTVTGVNDPPAFTSSPVLAATEDQLYTYAVTAADVDAGATLTLTAPVKPAWLTLVDAGNGTATLSGTPGNADVGPHAVTLAVSDGTATVEQSFTVTVAGVNDPPTIADISDQTTAEDTTLAGVPFTVGDPDTPAGSLVLSATSSDPALVPPSSVTFGGAGTARTLSIVPAADRFGTTTITVTVSDGALTASDAFVLTVTPVNDLPTLSAIVDQATTEDVPVGPVAFTVGDQETPAAALTVTASSSDTTLLPPAGIVLGGAGATRTVTLTPAADRSGEALVTLRVADADGGERTASFRLVVTPANDAPVLDPIPDHVTPEDVTTVVTVTVSDIDTPLDGVTLTASSGNTAVVAPGGLAWDPGTGPVRTLRITPVANASGATEITVQARDGVAPPASRAFTLTVTAVNDAPTVSQLTDQATPEDTPIGPIAFTVGDVETAAASLTVTAASSNTGLLPLAGIVVGGSGASRTVTLTPAHDQSGTATVTLTVSDGSLGTPMAFTLTVTAVNDRPTISDIGNVSTPQEIATGDIPFTVGDVDTPATSLGVSAVSSNTTLVPNVNITLGGTGTSRTIRLVPATGQTGSTTVTVTVSDGALQAADTFVLTVTPPNAPVISGLPASASTPEDTATAPIAFTVSDVDGLVGPVTAVSSNTTLVPNAPSNIVVGGGPAVGPRTITLTPAANQFGSTTITITAKDHTLDPSRDTVASFTLTVTPVNDAPSIVAIASPQITNEDVVKTVPVSVSDPDPTDVLTVTASSSNQAVVANAGLAVTGTGASRTLTITPVANASGTASITVQVSDGTAPAASTQFTLTVNAVNDAPTITSVGDRTTTEDTAAGPIAFTVGDVETAAASLTLSRTSSNTTLLPLSGIVFGGSGAARTVTLTPAANQFGETTVTLTVSDGSANASTAFRLTVTAVNDAPTLAAIGDQSTDEDTPWPVSITVGDVDDDLAVLRLTATSSNPAVIPVAGIVFSGTGAARTMTLTPAANASGVATIAVRAEDDQAPTPAFVQRSFSLTVRAVNDAPTISAIPDQQSPEDAPIGPIGFTVGDVDNDVSSLAIGVTSSNEALVRNTGIQLGGTGRDRTLTIQPEFGRSGTTLITVTVGDGALATTESFDLGISSVPCSYVVAPDVTSVGAGGGAVTMAVTTNRSSCGWTAASDAPWAVPEAPGPFFNNGSVKFTVLANGSGAARVATLTVGGQAVRVTQAGAVICTYSLSPASQQVEASGGVVALAVTASGSGCVAWTAGSGAPWLVVASGSGTGSGVISMTAGANATGERRTATVTLAWGENTATATVTQPVPTACTYEVSPLRIAFGPAGGVRPLEVRAAGGSGQCAWSLLVEGEARWLTLSGPQGFGSGAVEVQVGDNAGPVPREARVLVRDGNNAQVASVTVAQDSATAGDADDDGLPSAWEKQFGLDSAAAGGDSGALGDPDGDGLTNIEERRNCDRRVGCTHPRGFAQHTRYLAEGATSAFFDTRLAILNPGDEPANVLLRFQLSDGTAHTHYVAVPARARRTVDVGGDVDAMEQAEFSTVLESDQAVVVDRTMAWDRSGYGSHAETGLSAPATTWYLAEGATHSGFDLFYLLQNPASVPTTVRVRYLRPDGAPIEKSYTLEPQSRTNIWVDNEVFGDAGTALANTDVSAVITSADDTPIIVERAMYLTGQGRFFNAGHESAGVTAPATTWLLAEGATGPFFDLFVLLANPDDRAAEARLTYLLPEGTTYTRSLTVPPNSRRTVWVDFDTPDGAVGRPLASTAVSTTVEVTNGVPIIVERAMWWPGPTPATWAEAHNSAGATQAGTLWALAEGEESSLTDTYLLVANTSATAGTARVTLVFEDGTSIDRTFPLAATSRTNVAVGVEFPEAAGRRFGAIVESLGDTPAMVVVERAMYTSAAGLYWSAGTNALATRLR